MSPEIAIQRIKAASENGDEILDLSNLGLKKLPNEISELRGLTHLYLSNNDLVVIDELTGLSELRMIALQGNKLADLPIFLLNLDVRLTWENNSSFIRLLHIILSKEITQSIFPCLDIIQSVAGARARVVERTRDLERDLHRARELDLSLERIRALAQDIFRDPVLAPDLINDILHARALVQGLAEALLQARDIDIDIAQARKLRTQVLAQAQTKAQDLGRYLAQALAEVRIPDFAQDPVKDPTRAQIQALTRDLNRDLSQDRARSRYHNLAQDLDQARFLTREIWDAFVLPYNTETLEMRGIYLKDTLIASPPPEIIKQGNNAVKTFLHEYIEKESFNEVKAILVGEGAAGKTSLIKRLLNISFNKKEPQTHGVKILKQKFTYHQQDFHVNFWDFGGQEIMHSTHQFFLTKRCLYVLVLDSRKDEKAEYWLNYIQSFGGDAPVIVVLNKMDENPSFDVNRQFLIKKYKNIVRFHKTSCLTDNGMDDLRKDMMDTLWNLELRNTLFPKGWYKVKQVLESMTEDHISYSKYGMICVKNHVTSQESQIILLELLNDLGVVLNYEQLKLYDTQVLNPLWLTNAVYRIINSPILAQSNGRFNISELDDIINDPRYQKENPDHWTNIFQFWKPEEKLEQVPAAKFLFIVAMMNQFELLFQIDESNYIIPGLLNVEENSYIFKPGDKTLSFVIEYMDFLPTSIIPRLMVKLNKYIFQDQVWKTGMVLEENLLFNSIANIVLDKESKKINIEISGGRNRDFLTVIRETIKEINASYKDLNITEWIPLPDLHNNEQVLVDYQELLGYEKMEQQEYPSGKLQKKYPVSDLLNGIEKPEMRIESKSVHIFVSYAGEDRDYKEKLIEHLMPLIRLNKASVWNDSHINAGEDWDKEIFEHLDKSDIVLCLISSSFIASDFCFTKELSRALRSNDKGKIVIPLRIKEANWDKLEIAKIQGLPVEWMKDINDNKAWTEISKGVEAAIDRMKEGL